MNLSTAEFGGEILVGLLTTWSQWNTSVSQRSRAAAKDLDPKVEFLCVDSVVFVALWWTLIVRRTITESAENTKGCAF
jgi:hypothetical protein